MVRSIMKKIPFFHFLCDPISSTENTYIMNFSETLIFLMATKIWREWWFWIEKTLIFDESRARSCFQTAPTGFYGFQLDKMSTNGIGLLLLGPNTRKKYKK